MSGFPLLHGKSMYVFPMDFLGLGCRSTAQLIPIVGIFKHLLSYIIHVYDIYFRGDLINPQYYIVLGMFYLINIMHTIT